MTKDNDMSKILTRASTVADATKRFSVSSDAPIYDADYDEYHILVHDATSIGLEKYRTSGVPLLRDHMDMCQLGTVELNNVEIADGKLYVKSIVWRSDDESQTYKTDFTNGAVRNVSIRARMYEGFSAGEYNDKPLVRVTKWEPIEISLVSIPADNSVGLYRNDNSNKKDINICKESKSTISLSEKMANDNQEQKKFDQELERRLKEGQEAFVEQMQYIQTMAAEHDLDKEVTRKLIAEKAKKDQVLEAVVARQDEIARNRVHQVSGEPEPIAAVTSETFDDAPEKYNLAEVFRALRDRDYNTKAFGHARDVSKELSRGVQLGANSIMIPFGALINHNDMTPTQFDRYKSRRELSRKYVTNELTPTTLYTQDFIDALYNKNVLLQLGINTLTGLQGNFDIGAIGGKSTTAWLSDPSNTGATEDQVLVAPKNDAGKRSLAPKRLGSLNTISNFNINQTPYSVETIIRRDMMNGINEAIQKVVFSRTNTAPAPKSISQLLPAANIEPGVTAPNGEELNVNDLLDLVAIVGDNDGIINRQNTALVVPFSGMTAMYKFSTRNEYPLIAPGSVPTMQADGVMSLPVTGIGERLAVTNSVPNKLTRGNTGNAFDVMFGDFSQLYWGIWGGGIQVALGENGNDFAGDRMSIRAIMTTDITLRNTASFAIHRNRVG